jgi:hypothetical protein
MNVRGAVYFYPSKQSSLAGDPERKTALLSINSPHTNS